MISSSVLHDAGISPGDVLVDFALSLSFRNFKVSSKFTQILVDPKNCSRTVFEDYFVVKLQPPSMHLCPCSLGRNFSVWFTLIFIYFIWLCQVLAAAHWNFDLCWGMLDFFFFQFWHAESSCGTWTLSCGMWDLVPWPRMEPRSPALGAWSLSHWTTTYDIIWHFSRVTQDFKNVYLSCKKGTILA